MVGPWFGRVVILFLGAAIALGGCDRHKDKTAQGSDSPRKVRLILNWKAEPEFGGFYAAREQGMFAKHGLDVDIIEGGVGTPTIQMLGTGKTEFAIVSADELIIARSRGNDSVAVFAVYQLDPHAIMAHASRGFKSMADVFNKGGTLGIQRGYPFALFLEKKYGFQNVKIVPSPGGDLSVFLNDPNFSQQCFVTSEPILAKRHGGDPVVFPITDEGYNPYTTVVAVQKDLLRRDPAMVKAMFDTCREGWTTYLTNPGPTNQVIQKLNPSMDPVMLVESAKAQEPLIRGKGEQVGIGSMTRDRWQTLANQLLDLKLIDKAPAPEECFWDGNAATTQPAAGK
jgi:NitT/TauT family transport system substrate-binding protein